MAENPLLPHRKLKELHALMLRARSLSKGHAGAPHFEAVLASTLMHVEPGDFVSPPPGGVAPVILAAERTALGTRKKSAAEVSEAALPARQRLAAAAGIAKGLKLAGANRVVIVYTDAGINSARNAADWDDALAYATRAGLPLLVVCADATGGARIASPKAISWESMSRLGKRLGLPVFPVDGEDAVAVYRVMQESALHARLGAGPAVLWAILTPCTTKLSRGKMPVARLEEYLSSRGISLKRE